MANNINHEPCQLAHLRHRRKTYHSWLALLISLSVGVAASIIWYQLEQTATAQFAKRAEAESYTTRSQLARRLQGQMQALLDVADYWDTYSHLSQDQWRKDAKIELSHFQGIDVILWSDAHNDIRYATTPAEFSFTNRPNDELWSQQKALFQEIEPGDEATIVGPTRRQDHWSYRVVIPGQRHTKSGILIARIDLQSLLDGFFLDRSPGYAISVAWGEQAIYQRDQPAPSVDNSWVREGWIELPAGARWRVVHTPTDALRRTLSGPAIPSVLVAGWVIAALLGILILQNGRVRRRAESAERAENNVRSLNADLEQQVSLRTRELAQRTFDLETITESVSHDLRNPLNDISVNTTLLEHSPPAGPSVRNEVVERINHAKHRMVRILDRLDGFSHVSFAPFQRETVAMKGLVEEIFGELVAAEPSPNIELCLHELADCEADASMARILWLNLLENAFKYTRGKPQRKIEVGMLINAECATYYLRDNGAGFAKAAADHIFEPFQQFGETNQTYGRGRGLGLAIASRIVYRHGGDIWAEGTPDSGATFYFKLAPGKGPSNNADGLDPLTDPERSTPS